jgi:hypothetical protein
VITEIIAHCRRPFVQESHANSNSLANLTANISSLIDAIREVAIKNESDITDGLRQRVERLYRHVHFGECIAECANNLN